MVGLAQLVRAPDCGSGGRGFDSHNPPQNAGTQDPLCAIFKKTIQFICASANEQIYWDVAKSVRQRALTPSFRRFESCHPNQ